MIHISKRLQTVASMVTVGNTVADIGCDHAYTGIYLVSSGISPHVIAMDLRPGPLEKAKENIAAEGLEDRIEIRLSDGLDGLADNKTDTILISGMGGPLILNILKKNIRKARSADELILSPQSDLEEFPEGLKKLGFGIEEIKIVADEEKFYFVFKAAFGTDTEEGLRPEPADVWAACLKSEEAKKKLILKKLEAENGEKAAERRREIHEDIRRIEDEINRMRNRERI